MAVTTAAQSSELEKSTIKKITRRLIPFLVVLYMINFSTAPTSASRPREWKPI